MAGETAEGLRFARLAAERDPEAFVYHWIHSLAGHWDGAFDESLAACDRAAAVSDRHHFTTSHRAVTCADCERLAEARALHEELLTRRAQGYVPLFSLAMSASAIGDMDAALEFAQQACDEREPALVIMTRVLPNSRRLRDDPRFGDVLRRLAFPKLP